MTDLAKWRSIGVTGVRTDGTDRFRSDRERQLATDQKWYRQARKEGIQPVGTGLSKVEYAIRESDRLGHAYRADKLTETYLPEQIQRGTIGGIGPWTQSPYFAPPSPGTESGS